MTDLDSRRPVCGGLRIASRTVLVTVPDRRRRAGLREQLSAAGFRVLESSTWTAALDLLAAHTVDVGIVDAAIDDYHTNPPEAERPSGELPIIFLVDDPAEFDWDAYALLDRAEVHPAAGTDRELVRRVCALSNRIERQALARRDAERLRSAVRRVSATIQATPDPVLMTDRLVEGLVEVFGIDMIRVGTFDDPRVPALAVQWKRDNDHLNPLDTTAHRPAIKALACQLWDTGTTLTWSQHRDRTPPPGVEEELFDFAVELGAEASISLPIGDGDAAFGLLWMATTHPRSWSALEISLLQHLVANVAHEMMQGQVITDQHEVLHRLERLDRAKNNFLATVNHELRTPLTSLSAYLDLVRDGAGGPVPEGAAQMLGAVARNAERLGALIDDVLTMSRMAAEDPELDWRVVDLSRAAERMLAKLGPVAAKAEIELVGHIQPGVLVDGDAVQLQQVVFRLLGNAIKFTQPGGGVEIEVSEDPDGGEPAVAVVVTDTGVGIPEDEVPELFTSFFRGSKAEAGAVAGSGLGLAIVAGLVEAHQGRVRVEPTEGGGTRVTVLLPKTRRGPAEVPDRLLGATRVLPPG